MNQAFTAVSEDQYPEIAQAILPIIQQHSVVIFEGAMGAGKTTFIRYLLANMGAEDEASSPTYSLVNEYDTEQGVVYHFDCYRLESEEEAYDIGLEEYLYGDGICFIEWPERVASLLPTNLLEVAISIDADRRRTINVREV
jgi:tRNA threonylcarbamoyladenosine biosynthesis protein TsaE